ncbi:MAG TPA: signal peptidase I [Acidimicrobiales bacterium]|nr:signal peptidase I [Acidimicrobiales bacterium]
MPPASAAPAPQPPLDRPDTANGPLPPPPGAARRRSRTRRVVIEWVSIIGVAVLAAVLLRLFVIGVYYIPSGSMEPTLKIGDKVLVNKLSYHMHSVHRGDVVVFKRPKNDYDVTIKDLIKRVIGLPDETISASGGHVFVDGQPIKEPWLPKGITTATFGPVHIPAGEYFVMGDNRPDSADSRVIGPIPGNLIVGRAFIVILPIGHIGTL